MKPGFSLIAVAISMLLYAHSALAQFSAPGDPLAGSNVNSFSLLLDAECPNTIEISAECWMRHFKGLPEKTTTLQKLKPLHVATTGIHPPPKQSQQELAAISPQERLLAELLAQASADRQVELIARALSNARQEAKFASESAESPAGHPSNLIQNSAASGQAAARFVDRFNPIAPDGIQERLARLEQSLNRLSHAVAKLEPPVHQTTVNPFCLPSYSHQVLPAANAEPFAVFHIPQSSYSVPGKSHSGSADDARVAELQGEINQLEQMVERASQRISELAVQLQVLQNSAAAQAHPAPMKLR